MNSMTFSAALSMVLMAGADLFTGNNFILSSAAFAKKMKWSDVVKIWVVCYLGNLVGSLIAAFIFQASGAASGTVGQLFAAAAEKKMTAPGHQSRTERPALQHSGMYRRMVQHQTEKRGRKAHHDHVVYPHLHALRL